jgi:hypothetical protein
VISPLLGKVERAKSRFRFNESRLWHPYYDGDHHASSWLIPQKVDTTMLGVGAMHDELLRAGLPMTFRLSNTIDES